MKWTTILKFKQTNKIKWSKPYYEMILIDHMIYWFIEKWNTIFFVWKLFIIWSRLKNLFLDIEIIIGWIVFFDRNLRFSPVCSGFYFSQPENNNNKNSEFSNLNIINTGKKTLKILKKNYEWMIHVTSRFSLNIYVIRVFSSISVAMVKNVQNIFFG